MSITLTSDQEAWIKARVASGDFASVEEGVRRLIDQSIVEYALIDGDDLRWAKPLVDEARGDVARGDVIPLEEFEGCSADRLAASKG